MKIGREGQALRALDAALHLALMVFSFSLTVGIALTQISLGLCVALWLAKCSVSRRWLGSRTSLDGWLGLFLAACVLSTLFSVAPLESLGQLKKFYLVAAFYLLAWTVRDLGQVKRLVSLFLAGAFLTSAYGLARHLVGTDPRLVGTQSMAMTSGGIYMMAGLLALSAIGPWPSRQRNGEAMLAWLYAAAISAGLFFTKTISAWLGWIAGAMAIFRNKRWALSTMALAVLALSALFAFRGEEMQGFLTVNKPGSMQVRLNQWRMGWKLFKQRPVTGYGLIDLQGQYHDVPYDNPYWHEAVSTGHLHNNIVHIAVTTGLVGLLAFSWLWIAVFKALSGTLKKAGEDAKPLARGFLACAIGFMVSGLFEWNFGDSEPMTIIWFVLGLAAAAGGRGDAAREARPIVSGIAPGDGVDQGPADANGA